MYYKEYSGSYFKPFLLYIVIMSLWNFKLYLIFLNNILEIKGY